MIDQDRVNRIQALSTMLNGKIDQWVDDNFVDESEAITAIFGLICLRIARVPSAEQRKNLLDIATDRKDLETHIALLIEEQRL